MYPRDIKIIIINILYSNIKCLRHYLLGIEDRIRQKYQNFFIKWSFLEIRYWIVNLPVEDIVAFVCDAFTAL